MTPEQFCYWLQGRAELMPDTPPSATEWKMIGEHLAAVFHKVTPPLSPGVIHKDGSENLMRPSGPPAPSIADLQRAKQAQPLIDWAQLDVRC